MSAAEYKKQESGYNTVLKSYYTKAKEGCDENKTADKE